MIANMLGAFIIMCFGLWGLTLMRFHEYEERPWYPWIIVWGTLLILIVF